MSCRCASFLVIDFVTFSKSDLHQLFSKFLSGMVFDDCQILKVVFGQPE